MRPAPRVNEFGSTPRRWLRSNACFTFSEFGVNRISLPLPSFENWRGSFFFTTSVAALQSLLDGIRERIAGPRGLLLFRGRMDVASLPKRDVLVVCICTR